MRKATCIEVFYCRLTADLILASNKYPDLISMNSYSGIVQSMRKVLVMFGLALLVFFLPACSTQDNSQESQEAPVVENPLADLTFASDSTDAYKRACYWGSQGSNIFMFERIKEGNALAEQEGVLPLLGVEQAMSVVVQKGEPRAKKEYETVERFCNSIGIPLND